MATTAHLERLNAAQRKAVTHGEPLPEKGSRAGPLLIVAGAGTGKTDTLAHRVAHLVINGVDPARILMLTFTRRAATEMRRRAHEITRKALDEPLGGVSQTHRAAAELDRHVPLDRQPPAAPLRPAPAARPALQRHRSRRFRRPHGQPAPGAGAGRQGAALPAQGHLPADLLQPRQHARARCKETLEQHYPWCAQWEAELANLFRAYVEQKQHSRLLDYDDLLLYWHAMMCEPRLAQHVSAHFDHVLVDEYQDTNRLQAEILHALKPDGAGLVVVGDDAQAIYSFRAAAVENILGFPERFQPAAEVVTLAQNYRSTQPVLDVANAVMAEAPRQHRKYLLSVRGDGARPRAVTVDELQTQAEYVCTEVLKRREASVPLKRQAVLFRTASHSDMLEVELTKRKIPFVKYGGLKFLEAAHIKDLLGVLRWADNPRNALAAFRTLQLLPGMGPVNARAALDHFEAGGHSFEALKSFKPAADPGRSTGSAWSSCCRRSPSRSAPGRARSTWRASGTGRTSSASTSSSTRAWGTWSSSSCCPRSSPRASAS